MILILGGARSGKTKFVVELTKKQCRRVVYIATAPACDKEMRQRIKIHRKSRPKSWVTIEAQKDLIPYLKKIPKNIDGVIIECIGTYISNLIIGGYTNSKIVKNIKEVLGYLKAMGKKVFIVSNEVGSGVVPESALGREFRDILGIINQIITKYSGEVYLIVAGLPLRLK